MFNFQKNVKKLTMLMIASSLLLVAGCGGAPVQEAKEKQPFVVETMPLAAFDQAAFIKKSGKLVGSQEITVSSQARGRIESIRAIEGQYVRKGQTIVSLGDTLDNLGISLQRARLAEERARLNYEQTKVNIQKGIDDLNLAVKNANNTYITTKEQTEQTLDQAKLTLQNALSSNTGSKATLDLQKAFTDIENSITTTKNSFGAQYDSLFALIDSLTYQGDILLGYSDEFETLNDRYEIFLGSKNSQAVRDAEVLLGKLYANKDILQSLDRSGNAYTNAQMLDNLELLDESYALVGEFLDTIILVLESSTESVSFPQSQINGQISVFRGIQSSYTATYGGFIAYYNGAKNVFSPVVNSDDTTLIDQQLQILEKNTEIAEKNAKIAYEQTVTSIKDLRFKADLGRKTAQSNLTNALATQQTQLDLLRNAWNDAINARRDIELRYNNFFVQSPIDGVVGDIIVDRGQEITIGTPLFTVVNQSQQQIEVGLSSQERQYIDTQTDIAIVSDGEAYSGNILSISSVATQNLQFKAIIDINSSRQLVGDVAQVTVPIITNYVLLPLDIVTITKPNQGFIYMRNGDDIQKVFVDLGDVFDDKIELRSSLTGRAEIVTTPVKNYDDVNFYFVFE